MPLRKLLAIGPLLVFAACSDDAHLTAPEMSGLAPDLSASTAVLVVTSAADDGSPGTLRAVIDAAANGDVITFDPALGAGPLVVNSSPIIIDRSVVISGPPTGLTIRGNGSAIFLVDHGTYQVVMENLTLREGSGWGMEGGAILNRGNLRIRHSALTENHAGFRGGAIFNTGSLIIENSTISNNGVNPETLGRTERGGGIASLGTLTIINSTISGNSASQVGGGLAVVGTTSLLHTTVAGNGARFGGGIEIWSSSSLASTTDIVNSIVASNFADSETAGPDIIDITAYSTTAASHSLIGTAGGHSIVAVDGNLVGVDAAFVMDGFRPLLADNGGPTLTHALLGGSPALNAADAAACTAAPVDGLDQRGFSRTPADGCDMGSYERDDVIVIPVSVSSLSIGSATVDQNTGAAYVTGSMTCDTPGVVNLGVALAQDQKQRRLSVTVIGTNAVSIPCEGVTPWAMAIIGSNGVFVNGEANVEAATSNVEPQATASASVRMHWSR